VLPSRLDPALRLLFTHMKNFDSGRPGFAGRRTTVLVGTIHSEEKHPISRLLIGFTSPWPLWSLRRRWFVIAGRLLS